MIYQSKDNPNSHLTVKERKKPSLPVKALWERALINGSVLDFGCGLGIDVAFLQEKDFAVIGFDPHYKPNYPKAKFDTIICNYVLNVLLPEEQSHALMAISELLKPGGKAFFSVRRDIKRNGFLFNPKHKAKTYQCNVILPYTSIFRTENCEIYQYQHYTHLNKGNVNISPFFKGIDEKILITESATAFAIAEECSISSGHTLVIPKRKIANYFELSQHEQTACWLVVNRVQETLRKKLNANGFNIRMNIGKAGGQAVEHAHIHVIPRFNNNLPEPTSGIRNIFPK